MSASGPFAHPRRFGLDSPVARRPCPRSSIAGVSSRGIPVPQPPWSRENEDRSLRGKVCGAVVGPVKRRAGDSRPTRPAERQLWPVAGFGNRVMPRSRQTLQRLQRAAHRGPQAAGAGAHGSAWLTSIIRTPPARTVDTLRPAFSHICAVRSQNRASRRRHVQRRALAFGGEAVPAQLRVELPHRVGPPQPERRAVAPRPEAGAVRHDEQRPPARPQHPPAFVQQFRRGSRSSPAHA